MNYCILGEITIEIAYICEVLLLKISAARDLVILLKNNIIWPSRTAFNIKIL